MALTVGMPDRDADGYTDTLRSEWMWFKLTMEVDLLSFWFNSVESTQCWNRTDFFVQTLQ